jgi:hypothetical protein
MSMPEVTVELALSSGYTTAAASRTWTDVTDYVEAQRGLPIQLGRPDQFSTVQPSRLSLTFDNTDGRFTPEYAAGAYYPNIKKGRPIRVSASSGGVAYNTAILADSPLMYLRLGESAGTTAEDASPNNRDGTYSGTYTLGQASLSGTSDTSTDFGGGKVEVTYGAWMDVTSFTLGAIIKPDSVTGTRTIVSRHSGVGCWTFRLDGSVLRCYIHDGGSYQTVTAATPMVVGTTYTVGVTFNDATNAAVIYVNGVADGSATISTVTIGSSPIRVGDGIGEPFDGLIDEVSLFGSMLSPARMAAHHAARSTASRTLFTGYVDEWPVDWPGGSDAHSSVTVTASSRMARLGRSTEFKSIVEEEILYDSPVLYWPLGEPANSTTAGNIAPGRTEILTAAQVGTGGTLTFGSGIGPGTDDLTAPTLTPVDINNGLYLHSALVTPVNTNSTLNIQMECFFVPDAGQTDSRLLMVLSGNEYTVGYGVLRLVFDASTNSVYGGAIPPGGGAGDVTAVSAASSVTVGELNHVVLKATLNNTTKKCTAALIVNGGTAVTSTSVVNWSLADSAGNVFFPTFTQLHVGGLGYVTSTYGLFSGVIAHAAVFAQNATAVTDARFVEHYNAGDNGFDSDASGARIERYARMAGIPTAEISTETGLSTSIAHKDTTGETPLSAMEAVALTEDGVVFDAGDGTLTFHARDHRYAATSAFTLDCDAGDVEAGYMPRLDDQHLTNDMTASRPEGVKIRATNDDSITEYGYYRDTVEILTTSDNEVQARADWQVQRFGTPRVTVPDVAVELTGCDSSLVASLLAAEIGTRFTVDNLPTQAPASSADYFVEGITYDIGVESFRMSFNTSPAEYADAWTLDSASRSQLDTTTVLAY